MQTEKYSTNLIKTKYVNDSKITDHYAITPTGQGYENLDKLPELQKQVYDLIVHRFLAIFFPPAEYNKLNITIDVNKEKFYASTRVCVNKGYLEALPKLKDTKQDNKEDKNEEDDVKQINGDLKKGQKLEVKGYEIKESETTPPTRYNS